MQSNLGKYKDRCESLAAAGKLFNQGGNAKDLIHNSLNEKCPPEVIAKFNNTNANRPGVGQVRRHHGKFYDNDEIITTNIYHGVPCVKSLTTKELISPEMNTRFEDALLQNKQSIYKSVKEQPLGESPSTPLYAPKDIKRRNAPFGKPTIFSGTARECVNPNKTTDEIEEETRNFHKLYVKSHHDYYVGELPDRKYNWSKVSMDSTFGLPTPHSNTGELTKKSLNWPYHINGKITSDILDNFLEQTKPQLGQVLDRNKALRKVPDDHTYGVMIRPDEYGAGDLLHLRSPSDYLRGRDFERSVLHAIRQHLKKSNYHNFNSLSHAFAYYDKNDDKLIDADELRSVCHQLNLPIDDHMISLLMSYCVGNETSDEDKVGIDYVKFANFLNWKEKNDLVVDNGPL